jgi:hypothetical protein
MEILVDPQIPQNEIWFSQRQPGLYWEQRLTPAGNLEVRLVRNYKLLGKITNL